MSEKWLQTYTPKNALVFRNQRTDEQKVFKTGEIKLQIEGEKGELVSVRGKYPLDDWFTACPFSLLTVFKQAEAEKKEKITKRRELLRQSEELIKKIQEERRHG